MTVVKFFYIFFSSLLLLLSFKCFFFLALIPCKMRGVQSVISVLLLFVQ